MNTFQRLFFPAFLKELETIQQKVGKCYAFINKDDDIHK